MKTIPLTKGRFALVDDEDCDALSTYNWHLQTTPKGNVYAARREDRLTLMMHCQILGVKGVDHRDWDGLNNQRSNLRPATQKQNSLNHPGHKDRNSRFKGVTWHEPRQSWFARFRSQYLGITKSEEAAARLYDAAAYAADPEFAYLNFPEELSCQV